MSIVRYPTGIINPHHRYVAKQNNDLDYKHKMIMMIKPHKDINHHNHNKFYAEQINIDGYSFDSHAEGAFYLFAKRNEKIFSMQTRFYYRYNVKYKSRINNAYLALSNRSYRPDFVLYKPTVLKHYRSLLRPHGVLDVKNIHYPTNRLVNQISAIIDVKGKHYMTATASQRMDDFSNCYHLPVIIVRLNRDAYTLNYYIKGYRKNKKSISLLK